MPEIRITEKFLIDTGGWQALKHAKALLEMGRVVSFNYTPPVLHGLVREGEIEYRAGLKIRSYTDVENLCSCRDSREWGTICAHSLALALALIQPKPVPAKSASLPVSARLPILVAEGNACSGIGASGDDHALADRLPDGHWIELHIVLAPHLETTWDRDQVMVGFEVVRKDNRTLASALDPNQTYRCTRIDRDALELAREFVGGKLPGMTILSRDQFLKLIAGLVSHPRITLARKTSVTVSGEGVLPKLVTEKLADGRWKISADTSSLNGNWLVGSERAWLWSELRFNPVSPGLPAAYLPVLRGPIVLPAEQGLNFVQRELPGLRNFFRFDTQVESGRVPEPGAPEVFSTFEGSLNQLGAKLQCLYGQRMVTLGVTNPAEAFVYQEQDAIRSRNLAFERSCLSRLQEIGFVGPSTVGEYTLRGQNAILSFFARDLPQLQKEWKVSIGSRFQNLACGRQLNHTWHYRGGGWVHASDLFNTAYPARDVSGVLRALHLGRVDLYGDSYGSWFSQVFASRYPGQLRSVTLDSTYQVLGLDPWYTTTVITARRAFDAGLRAVGGLCGGDRARRWRLGPDRCRWPGSWRARRSRARPRRQTAPAARSP